MAENRGCSSVDVRAYERKNDCKESEIWPKMGGLVRMKQAEIESNKSLNMAVFVV